MKPLLRLGGLVPLVVSVLGTLGGPCEAKPLQTKASLLALPAIPAGVLLGGELEAQVGSAPLALGGQAVFAPGGLHSQGTLWLRYAHPLSEDVSLGGLAGLNLTWDQKMTPTTDATSEGSLSQGPLGYVVGVSVRKEWGPVWLQSTPNYVFIPGFMSYWTIREAVISGIPWLEIGYKITPSFDVSLRSSLTPLTASILF